MTDHGVAVGSTDSDRGSSEVQAAVAQAQSEPGPAASVSPAKPGSLACIERPAFAATETLRRYRSLLGGWPFRDPARQAQCEAILVEIVTGFKLTTFSALMRAREVVILEMDARRARAAVETHLFALRHWAALEVLFPGAVDVLEKYNLANVNIGPINGVEQLDRRLRELGLPMTGTGPFYAQAKNTIAMAIEKLARQGRGEEALEDIALRIGVEQIIKLNKLRQDAEAARDKHLAALQAHLVQTPVSPAVIDAEFENVVV